MYFQKIAVGILSTLALGSSIHEAKAEVKLAPIFTDNMVLQRDKPIPVWGTAAPGEKVSVTLTRQWDPKKPLNLREKAPETLTATTDVNGSWKVVLPSTQYSQWVMSFKLDAINANNKTDSVQLQNIALGDVYICSGQSNMEWPVSASNNAQAEIAAADFPDIRLLTVPKKIAATPQKEFGGATNWQVCSPESVKEFSAVGYFFGRAIHQKIGIPIGLIDSSWGGTVAEAWVSREALAPLDPAFRSRLQTLDNQFAESQKAGALNPMVTWWQDNDAGSKVGKSWSAPAFDDAAWPEMTVPQTWESTGVAEFKDFDGLVWFRKQIEIPAGWEGKDLTLHLGAIDDNETTFFNGVEIGSTSGWNAKRVYNIPADLVKAGRATIAVRVFDGSQGGGLIGGEPRRLEKKENAQNAIPLDGVWKIRASTPSAKLAPTPVSWQTNPNQVSVLFNGMIAPLVPFSVRGAIWYQGESNVSHPQVYRTLFPALIRDWRTQWNARQDGSEFGFYFVQLASYMARTEEPVQSGWAELREVQTATLNVPRTGMATTIDVGEAADIHPKNKQDVGMRLALAALATEYGQKIEYSGPMFSKMEMVAGKPEIRIQLTHAMGLKTTDGTAPRTFAIQDVAGKWFAATARIEGQSVVLSNSEVLQPKAARYAWANNPDVNLVNAAGLPAVSFRTDAP